MNRFLVVAMALLLSGSQLSAVQVAFSSPPTMKRTDGGGVVSFALKAPLDVEVAILDAKGKVVRHLAAGVLGGKHSPPAPLKPGLSQAISWDGKDNFGKPAGGGPFKARVRAGTSVKFGRSLTDTPYMINAIRALATDAEGNLYVLNQNFNKGPYHLQVFSADGKYIRTLLPFPASLPRESVQGFAYWDEENNRPIPRNQQDTYPEYLPLDYHFHHRQPLSMAPRVTGGSGLLLYTQNSVFRLDADGGTGGRPLRYSWLFFKGLSPYESAYRRLSVANSPDGKILYAAGPTARTSKEGVLLNKLWPASQIYSMPVESGGRMKTFVSLEKELGGKAIHGLSTGPKGNLYVHSRSANAVVALNPRGEKLGRLDLEDPHRTAVHPSSGALYVLCVIGSRSSGWNTSLLKFSDLKSSEPAARLDLGKGGGGNPVLAVTCKGDRTLVWVGGLKGGGRYAGARGDLTCYEETGTEFKVVTKLHEINTNAMPRHDCIAVDPVHNEVYVNDDFSAIYRYNGLTGEGGRLKRGEKDFYSQDLSIGADGHVYARTGGGYSGPLERFNRELKPVPFTSGSHVLSEYIYSRMGAGYAEKGVGVGRDGKVYMLCMYNWMRYCVFAFGPGGKLIEGPYLKGKLKAYTSKGKHLTSAMFGPVPQACGGVRVDSKGNVYFGFLVLPKNYAPPKALARDPGWGALVGSVVKFRPEGGHWVITHPKLKPRFPDEYKLDIPDGVPALKLEDGHVMVGATRCYPEYAPFSGSVGTLARQYLGRQNCACRSPRFDLDRYDRLYLPNAVKNTVRIYDNAGNLILQFGSYGNIDSAGPKSLIPKPEIGLAWPIGVGVSDEHIYVCDQLNRRVLRVDKQYALEAECKLE